jgi:phosphosulfolactate synthase
VVTTELAAGKPDPDSPIADALNLVLPALTIKPRDSGLTMVMDQGWPIGFTSDMLDDFGYALDIVKLWDPLLRVPFHQVEKRIHVYRDHGVIVQPGGIWLEMAARQGSPEKLLPQLGSMGFNAIEVSNTASEEGIEARARLVAEAARQGFRVLGEVGKKFFDGDDTRLTDDTIDHGRTVREFKQLLDAGAWKVYWEGHLLRKLLGDDPDAIKQRAYTGVRQFRDVVSEVGQENIIFEVSGLRPRANRQWLQFWLIRLAGSEVNIGNACIEELANLEALRGGTHPIFDLGSAGNYATLGQD